ncbi:MAG: D-proline reductase (dithiol) proprotein PrdA [Dorea sp.]
MSITAETAKQHANDPAVLCCRAEAGIIIEPANLEDPAIFDELVDSGLLNLDGCLKIGQILGAKLTKTLDSLSPITADVVEGAKDSVEEEVKEEVEEAAPVAAAPVAAAPVAAAPVAGGVLKIHIGEGKDIDLSIPVGALGGGAEVVEVAPAAAPAAVAPTAEEVAKEGKVVRSLTRKHFAITEVKRGPETKIEGTVLTIREGIEADVIANSDLVKDFHLEIVTPNEYHTYSETIMDVSPIATKEGDAKIGQGVTRVIDGAIMMLSGTDEGGVQIGEFGSSEGYLDENIMWGRPGCPDKGEIFIKGNIVVQEKTNMERRGPMAAHTAFDIITQEIREALKKLEENLVVDTEEFVQVRHPGQKKVVICKEIMGQGAMHDNFILPVEPCGILGARANVDLGNLPVCMSPLEVLDGCIHALTCIGPASKEMTRHYWREPLVLEALADPEIDLCGVIFVGSPQINAEKFYVSERLGQTVEMMDVDGAFITTEGFGNNHIDFASHHEQIGMRGVPVVGLSYCAVQGALVVGNKYMTAMVDNNKSEGGIENEILGNNTLCHEDAIRALEMLKVQMAGEVVKPAEKKWNPNVKATNIEVIEDAIGSKIDLVENEQALPLSQKRIDKGYN